MFRRSVADMSSIAFILRKSLKNNILELLRHPGKLVAYLFRGGLFAVFRPVYGPFLPRRSCRNFWISGSFRGSISPC